MEIWTKPILQYNTFLDFHYDTKTSLKYTGHSTLVNFSVMQCLLTATVPTSLTIKEFKVNNTLFSVFLGILIPPHCLLK